MIASVSYTISGLSSVQHEQDQHYAGVNAFDAQVLRSRAIAPDVAAARGTRTAGNRMIIPLWNTQGETGPEQYRPHNPTPGEDGKIRKYLFATGTRLIVDVHPLSLPSLDKVHIPLIITESALKADAILSAIAPGTFCVVSVSGVDGWRSGDMPLSDLRDIPMRVTKRQKLTFRRPVYIAYDSDAATKAGPMRARWELTEYLRRRKAQVHWIDVPARDGEKAGIDDALASGHTMEAMLASAYPAPDIMPAMDADLDDDSEAAQLRRRAAFWEAKAKDAERRALEAEARASAQAQVIMNPWLKDKPRAVAYSALTGAAAKLAKGVDVLPGNKVAMYASEIANDYRPARKGRPSMDLNPLDGSKPITSRTNAKKILAQLAEADAIDAEFQDVKRRAANGDTYDDKRIIITLPNYVQAMRTLASYTEEPNRKPYTWQPPCPHCGEVHSQTRRTTCNNCGQETAPPHIIPVPVAQRADITAAQRANLEERTAAPVEVETVDNETGEILSGTGGYRKNVYPISPPIENYTDRKNVHPAASWLSDALKGGMRPAADMERAAMQEGFTPDMVRTARDALRVESIQIPRDSRTYWTLPRERAS